MCELFGVNSEVSVNINTYLKNFISHSTRHPHGWGMAQFFGDAVSLEKEPKAAFNSDYLNSRVENDVVSQNLIAHIRLATCGQMIYDNCHPFVKRDQEDRAWTLAHNGTIFYSPLLDEYKMIEKGSTDSERILCHIIHEMNCRLQACGRTLTAEERFQVLDQIILDITPCNKVNLLIYDGELMYVHTNMESTLYYKKQTGKKESNTVFFATVPLDECEWNPVPMMQLQAYQNGQLMFTGSRHRNLYEKGDKAPVYDWATL